MRSTGGICIVSRKIVSDAGLGTRVTLSASETSEAAIEAASLSELNNSAAPKRSQKKFFTPPAIPERPSASLAGEPTSIATPRGVTARFHTAKQRYLPRWTPVWYSPKTPGPLSDRNSGVAGKGG